MDSDLLNILVEFIIPSINIGPMLIHCMPHPDLEGCAKELYEMHGEFWTTSICYCAGLRLCHPGQTRVLDQEICRLPVLESICRTSLLFCSLKKRIFFWPAVFYMGIGLKVLLPLDLRILAPQFEQLRSAKIFWGFIIIIIIIIFSSFVQGIYTYIPETNHVPREYIVAAILSILFVVPISPVPGLALLYFYVSTFRSMCAVPNMAVSVVP
jgi:hypothetical protein